jgi:hypothetical protein
MGSKLRRKKKIQTNLRMRSKLRRNREAQVFLPYPTRER